MKNYLNNKPNQGVHIFDELPLWSAPFGLKLLDYIDYRQNVSAIDIGFGTGFPLIEIAMRLGHGSTIYGIDPWKEIVEKTRKKVAFYEISNITLIESVAENIPLPNNSVNLITSNNGINNVSDIAKVFSECARIITDGGQFVQTMNLDKSMFEFYTEFEQILSEMYLLDEIAAMHQHIAKKRPSVDYFLTLLADNRFQVKDLVYDQFEYKFASGTALLNHHFIRLAFMDSWIKLLPNNKIEEVFDKVEEQLNKKAQMQKGIKLSIPYILINAIKD